MIAIRRAASAHLPGSTTQRELTEEVGEDHCFAVRTDQRYAFVSVAFEKHAYGFLEIICVTLIPGHVASGFAQDCSHMLMLPDKKGYMTYYQTNRQDKC